MNRKKMLSVIIVAYNSSKTISSCLDAICTSEFRDYELVVIDDKSTDNTMEIAKKYTEHVYVMPENKGAGHARDYGRKVATGDIFLFIDSDVIVYPHTLTMVVEYFARHIEVHAITGLLAKEHPNKDFFSQYKNLYMNYIFQQLPQQINFLYGSIHAIRRSASIFFDRVTKWAEDTEMGQNLAFQGKMLHFIPTLEVVHLKKHTFWSFLKNDFRVPFSWTKLFVKYQGWKQIGKKSSGFTHSPKEQLLSIATVGSICGLSFLSIFLDISGWWLVILLSIWFLLNKKFLFFLRKERGILFFMGSIVITFLDNFVMGCAIFFGLLIHSIKLTATEF